MIEFGCGSGDNLRLTGCEIKLGIEWEPAYPVRDGTINFIIGDARLIAPIVLTDSFELVLLINVLEYFDKNDGKKFLRQAQRIAGKRVLVWTPEGSIHAEQRSEWSRGDLSAHAFNVAVWEGYFPDMKTGKKTVPALFALWNSNGIAHWRDHHDPNDSII